MKTLIAGRSGIALAVIGAVISGVSVFANGQAMKHAPSALAFTTAKNMVAAGLILVVLLLLPKRARTFNVSLLGFREMLGLAFVAVVSGGIAFGLFFQGLASSDPVQAAFVQKSLVVWVAVLAIPLLGERLKWQHVAAICLLILGQTVLVGGLGSGSVARSLLLILGATIIWSVEVVIAKVLLRGIPSSVLATVRMAGGSVVLAAWLLATGALGQLGGIDWIAAGVVGLLLAGYVLTWFAALQRAPAVDVTAVLVLGAFVTALLTAAQSHAGSLDQILGMALILVGVGTVVTVYREGVSFPSPPVAPA